MTEKWETADTSIPKQGSLAECGGTLRKERHPRTSSPPRGDDLPTGWDFSGLFSILGGLSGKWFFITKSFYSILPIQPSFWVVLVVKNPSCRRCKRHRFDPWVEEIPWRRKWQPTPVFSPWTEEPSGLQSTGLQSQTQLSAHSGRLRILRTGCELFSLRACPRDHFPRWQRQLR